MARRVGIGLDVGTSGLDAMAVDEQGKIVAQAEAGYPLLTPRPGWSEQDPQAWWGAAREALAEVSDRLAGDYQPVALGLSGQMHGMVPLDDAGAVVRPALLWNDQRTGEAVKQMERALPREEYIERSGNPPITGFQLAKVLWLRQEEPENFARTKRILFPKDFLGFRLTDEFYTEPTDASGSNAFNIHGRAWDGDILAALDLDSTMWPEAANSRAVIGGLLPSVAEELGLPAGLNVVAGAGDNAAAAYGMGLGSERPELGSVSLGTSGVIFAAQSEGRADPQGRVHLFCHADGGYHLLGVTLAAAGSLRWFRDTFAPGRSFSDLVHLAREVEPGAQGVTFKPYLAGERTPHLDPTLRGSFSGLSLATDLPQMIRAVLEGVAFSLRDALEVMRPLSSLERALLIGGGSQSEVWSRIIADVLQMPLGIAARSEGPSYGAARLALETVGAEAPEPGETEATWLEPGDFDPYAAAFERYRQLGP